MEKAAKQAWSRGLFLFRKDLRLDDNTGLIWLLKRAEKVYPVYVFDEDEISPQNPYFGQPSAQFLSESLEDLNQQLTSKGSKLSVIRGKYLQILKTLIASVNPDIVCVNREYTPTSINRDKVIQETCADLGVSFESFQDTTLVTLEEAKSAYSGGKKFFKRFTPYYQNTQNLTVKLPQECKTNNFANVSGIPTVDDFGKSLFTNNPKLIVSGGRDAGMKQLAKIDQMKNYWDRRCDLTRPTSMLGAYINRGCISVREVFHLVKTVLGEHSEDFLRQLYVRDFHYFLGVHYPEMFTGPMQVKYTKIPWRNDPEKIKAWQEGRTGCPVVDAAMRQMNAIGWMCYRNRLITSNFLVKNMHVSWQIGEEYFAKKLVDADQAQNNAGWQWTASTGTESQPYFQFFKASNQTANFDPDCKFVKEWVPELKGLTAKEIIEWESTHKKYSKLDYPAPLVFHDASRVVTLQLYKTSLELSGKIREDYVPPEPKKKVTRSKAETSKPEKTDKKTGVKKPKTKAQPKKSSKMMEEESEEDEYPESSNSQVGSSDEV